MGKRNPLATTTRTTEGIIMTPLELTLLSIIFSLIFVILCMASYILDLRHDIRDIEYDVVD